MKLPVILLSATMLAANAEIAVKDGEKIGFLGDSITQQGWSDARGYVKLVIAGLAANGIKAEPVPAGISGHKSNQMLERLQRDVLDKKPQWMTLSCGVNDIWHGVKGVPFDEYQKNIRSIVDQATAAGAKVVLLTSTPIGENSQFGMNLAQNFFNGFLRKLAEEKKLPLADVSESFWAELKVKGEPGKNVLTTDGVHMNAEGNKLMARGVLKALGANEAELKKAEEAWSSIAPK